MRNMALIYKSKAGEFEVIWKNKIIHSSNVKSRHNSKGIVLLS
jgi:hypothetical protein